MGLISTAIGEDVERKVVFNYHDVVNENHKKLHNRKKIDRSTHHHVRLRKLETKHVHGYKWKFLMKDCFYLKFSKKITSDIWQEDNIDIIINHKSLIGKIRF